MEPVVYFCSSRTCLYFGEYVAIVYTLINTLLIIVLYRHGIKCAITKVKHIVELKDRVLAPWGPSSISAVAELVEPDSSPEYSPKRKK